jgi:thymidylate synthase
MKHFRSRTAGCAVIMGKRTWNSLPIKPLPGRDNYIVSRSLIELDSRATTVPSLDAALLKLKKKPYVRTYVIGGSFLYREAITHPACEAIELSNIAVDQHGTTQFDSFFPEIPKNFELLESAPTSFGSVELWNNTRDELSQERDYLNELRLIRETGETVSDRTGVGTQQLFGRSLRFSLANGRIPLMTTKRVHWKSVAEEVLQFARGDIDARKLEAKGVKIWSGHTSRAHLDFIGAHHIEAGSMGKAYGFQWRQLGLPYLGIDAPYKDIRNALTSPGNAQQIAEKYPALRRPDIKVYDQLQSVVDQLKHNPTSRRIVLNAWNVADLSEMCLPPCHMVYVFNVSEGRLNCQMMQRSWDMFLGS